MASTSTPRKHERRTRAERRAATRTALLDASIECLVQEGYANTTTRRIADRAGVTPGALQHHFASRAELLGYAIRHVRKGFRQEMLAHGPPDAPSMRARCEQLLDRVWEVHSGRILYPEMAGEPGFAQVIDTGQAAIRGLALLAFVDETEADAAWLAVRAHTMALSAELIAAAASSP